MDGRPRERQGVRFGRNTTQIHDGLMNRQRNMTKPEGRMSGW